MHLTTGRRGAPRLPPNQSSVLNLSPKSRSHHTQTLTKPIFDSLLPTPVAVPRASLLTPARLNRHNRLPRGGSLQTALSDAQRSTEPTCVLTVGRIRYSTRVSREFAAPLVREADLNGAALRRTLSRAGCQQQCCKGDEEIGLGHKEMTYDPSSQNDARGTRAS